MKAKVEIVMVDGVEWIHSWIPTTGECKSFDSKEKDGSTKTVDGSPFTCWGTTKVPLRSGEVLAVKVSARREGGGSQEVCDAPGLETVMPAL